ncbi:MAG TPA: molybdate ABC transporter substrate-binding protein [Ramlibacter sp.]|jgi:molybdate transport system substrate-binding protein|uniref:molybdate ABC transporter substrate-binding protein n=1 Tax=Ramlibacter sp. TaxID=1917967 RepID=UPI002D22C239|nr:molybdate ABC transporter substrate-binding protein [Ramlibacter sp.]HZY20451.1 molybdate ABC transporter substrate-binding protein [Ramlibacter sp.]
MNSACASLLALARRLAAAVLAVPALGATGTARAADVSVAVAANFTAPMQAIAAAFERDTGHRAVLAFGSTGRFAAQVRHGAPFQVLLAADAETPARLEQEGLAVSGTRFTYATGRLVLWSATPGLVDAKGEVLARESGRIAIADPRLAPYGRAAEQAIEALGLTMQVRPRLVQGDSIAQVHQFVRSGNTPLGFVALSQVTRDGRIAQGSGWLVPARLHAPIRQDAVLLAAGRGQPAALALLAYLRAETARAVIRSHGYEL